MKCKAHPWSVMTGDGVCPSCELSARVEDSRALEARTEDQKRSRRQRTVGAKIKASHDRVRQARIDEAKVLRDRACELLRQGMSNRDVAKTIGRSHTWVSTTAASYPTVAEAVQESMRIRRERGENVRSRRGAP